MDLWAPRRSGLELAGDVQELALEPAEPPAQGGAPPLLPQETALDQGEESGRDLLGAPAAGRVVPLVDPVQHAEDAEDHQSRRHVPEHAGAHPFQHDALDPLVVAILLGGQRAREPRGQVRLLAEEHGQERPVGDDEPHVLPHHAPQLLGGIQARAQHQAEIPGEGLDGLPRDGGEHLLLGPEVGVERGLRHPEARRDVLHGGGLVAALPEEVRGGAQDLGAGRLALGVHRPSLLDRGPNPVLKLVSLEIILSGFQGGFPWRISSQPISSQPISRWNAA